MAAPLLLLLGALLAPPAAKARAAPTVQVTVGVLLPEDLSFPWARPRVAPALSLALEALQPQLSLDGLAVRTVFASTEEEDGTCDEEVTVWKAAELKGCHDPDVLLGLGCFDSAHLLEIFGRYSRLPLLRAGLYSRYDLHSEVVYAGPLGLRLPAFRARLFQHFSSTGLEVKVVAYDIYCGRFYDNMLENRWRQQRGEKRAAYFSAHIYTEPGETVQYIRDHGRVPFICGPLEIMHQIMRLAHAQNMTNGDYLFIYLDPLGKSLRAEGHRKACKPWHSNETKDIEGLREAFQTVLVITPHEPQTPEYRRFENELVLRAQRDFGLAINDSLGHLVAGCFHDGLLLYLKALNETLHEGGTKRNTSRILEKMRSLKIHGVTGMVSINSYNDREVEFDLWAMRDVDSGEFQVVGHYIASEDRINWTGDILWKKGGPPLDNPPCVFDKDAPSCVKRAPVLFYGVFLHTSGKRGMWKKQF